MRDVQLEKYTLETELSHDAWSTLYQGRHNADDSPVWVRIVTPLFATDEFFARRFVLMAEQNANLEHPNILPTQAAEQDSDWLYVVQDFVGARPLAEIIEDEAPLSLKRVQFIASQIASALDYAHQKSITHGGLSAHHIYVTSEGKDWVWLTGFGHSQLLFGANLAKYGWPGDNPEILAPERVQGQGPTRQADLYSLGVLCYQMLSKQLPFAGPSSAVRHAQAYRQPRPLHQVNTSISLPVSETVSRMLAKSVDVRYNTGAEFARAFLMAAYKRNTSLGFDHLLPLVERERQRSFTAKGVIYFSTALILVLLITLLSIWAGYELGLKQVVSSRPTPQVIVVTRTVPAAADQSGQVEDALALLVLYLPGRLRAERSS
jgi:serine/threonine-protein kinase